MKEEMSDILKQNNLSITASRQEILKLFLKNNKALSHADIEKKVHKTSDRITVYRTLQSFVEKGIVHVIPTADNSVKYALCKNDCTADRHYDNHVHFICNNCNKTTCLDNIDVPSIKLPKGFRANNAEMVVSGICSDCR